MSGVDYFSRRLGRDYPWDHQRCKVPPFISPPPDLCCPISKQLLLDPVVAADGFVYERNEITKWLTAQDTSPLTNLQLVNKALKSCSATQELLKQWCQNHHSKPVPLVQLSGSLSWYDVSDWFLGTASPPPDPTQTGDTQPGQRRPSRSYNYKKLVCSRDPSEFGVEYWEDRRPVDIEGNSGQAALGYVTLAGEGTTHCKAYVPKPWARGGRPGMYYGCSTPCRSGSSG